MTDSSSLDTIRFDQIGSLLRPQSLLDAWGRHAAGLISDEELEQAKDGAIRQAIARQESLGLQIVTDGEFRRLGFQDSFGTAVSGIQTSRHTFKQEAERYAKPAESHRVDSGLEGPGPAVFTRAPVVDRLKLVHNNILEEYQFVHSVTHTPAKVTLIGPDRLSQRFAWEHPRSKEVYPGGVEDYLVDALAIQRQMISETVAAGCRYIHIDEPGYTAYVDEGSLARMRSRGESPEKNLARSIRADNALIANFPGVTFGVHICRGNERAMWHREGHYDAIAEQLFSGLNFQRLMLEYDTERAGGFEPLRFVPKGRIVVLGLVTTKAGTLESEDELLRRIDAASKFLPLEQMAISPQCGFASTVIGNPLSEDEQWRKLEVLQKVANKVWGAV